MKTKFKRLYEKYQQYLPSKKFVSIFICIIVFIFLFKLTTSNKKAEVLTITGGKSEAALKIENQTINDLIQKDSDSDGISDWEEALWGTDKNKAATFNGVHDTTYIENKKKELNIEQSVNVTKLTETDKFAREFFTSFSAMKTSGQVDQNTINSFSNALGQKIADPTLINAYSEADIKILSGENNNDIKHKETYYAEVKKLFESYQSSGIGDELDIVNNALASSTTNNSSQFSKLPIIANAYQDFAKKLINIKVPSELSSYHLSIANSSNNTGISISGMKEIINDPLIGLQGLSQYQKYSDELVKNVTDLETALVQ